MIEFLKKAWHILTTPGKELLLEALEGWSFTVVLEFLQVTTLVFGLGILILFMLGARGKVAKCLYWDIALYFVLTILS